MEDPFPSARKNPDKAIVQIAPLKTGQGKAIRFSPVLGLADH